MAKLCDICDINMGQSPDSSTYNTDKKGLPFFQGNADFGKINPTVRIWCSQPIKIAHIDDILISVRAPIGALNLSDRECCIGRGLASLTVKPNTAQKYLWYALESNVDKLISLGTGSTFKAISKKVLFELEIPLPPLDIQQQIADNLDKVTRTIDICNTILEKLDLLVKSRFVEMFGDPETNPNGYPIKAISEIAEYWNGLTYKPEDVSENGTVVLRSSNIQNMQLDFADMVRVSCKIGEKKYVQDNDILMCSRNGSAKLVGKVALIHNLQEPMSFGAFMMIIRSSYYPYLMTYFQLPAFRSQIKTGATTTINQITVKMMDKIMMPIPDMNTVNKFADFVKQVDKSKLAVKQVLEKAETLKNALMQEYFG